MSAPEPLSAMTPREIVDELLSCNPFGGYRLPRNQQELSILTATLTRYRATNAKRKHNGELDEMAPTGRVLKGPGR